MDPEKFDKMVGQLSRVLSRRSLVGASLGSALFSVAGPDRETSGKSQKDIGGGANAESCLNIGERCPKTIRHGKKLVKHTCDENCCTHFSVSTVNSKARSIRRCACKPAGVGCSNASECCDGVCNGGVCGSPPVPTAPVCDPLSGVNCVPRGSACTRGGTPCCCADECIAGDSARGVCRPPCGPGTQRCNDGCVRFCELGEPHPGGCTACVCPPGTTITCSLGTEYPRSDTCCGVNQECCVQGELGDPTTVNVCCDSCGPLGTGCAS